MRPAGPPLWPDRAGAFFNRWFCDAQRWIYMRDDREIELRNADFVFPIQSHEAGVPDKSAEAVAVHPRSNKNAHRHVASRVARARRRLSRVRRKLSRARRKLPRVRGKPSGARRRLFPRKPQSFPRTSQTLRRAPQAFPCTRQTFLRAPQSHRRAREAPDRPPSGPANTPHTFTRQP